MSDFLLDIFSGLTTANNVGLEAFKTGTLKNAELTSVKNAFAIAAPNLVATPKLAKDIVLYCKDMMTKNEDHQQFFGGNLLGTQRIKFLDIDRNRWFDEILLVDESYLTECLHSVPAIRSDWNVSGDVFNLSCVYLLHLFMNAHKASQSIYEEAAIDVLIILQFKFISSIYSWYFKTPVDEDAAHATYAALSLKFALKQLGSWGALLRNRAVDVIGKSSIHYNTLMKLENDEDIIYVLSDINTRTRKVIKDQYAVLDNIRSNNLRIKTTSDTINIDGDKILRDRVNALNSAKYFLFDVSGNPTSFIKTDLVNVIIDVMVTVPVQSFNELLQTISNTKIGKDRDEIEWMMETTLMHAFDYIVKKRIRFNDAYTIIIKMRALYMSSKTQDPMILELRERIQKYIRRNSKVKIEAQLASMRTSLMLYFLIRALSANIYH